MTPRPLIAAAALTLAGLAACAPPQTNGRQQYPCDAIHMPGNELGWCVTWTRLNGMVVTGPVARRDFEQANPGVVVMIDDYECPVCHMQSDDRLELGWHALEKHDIWTLPEEDQS